MYVENLKYNTERFLNGGIKDKVKNKPQVFKFASRNINNLRYTDDTTLMAESKEELKLLLMNVKEEIEKVVLKLNI